MANFQICVTNLSTNQFAWIAVDFLDADEIQEAIDSQLGNPDEWIITESEGFGEAVDEYTKIDTVVELMEMIEKHDDAYLAYISNVGIHYATESDFENCYMGTWDSELSYAENLVADCGYLDQMPETLRHYFNYEKYASDLFISDYTSQTFNCQLYVFRR